MASKTAKTTASKTRTMDGLPNDFKGWSRVYCPECGTPTRTYFRVGEIYTNCEGCNQYFQTLVLPMGWDQKLNREKNRAKVGRRCS
jgi:ribosomal protein S27E